jgi:hypothetical protein
MLLALRQIEIPGTQRIFARQGQAGLPRVAVDLGGLIVEGSSQFFWESFAQVTLKFF